MSNPQTSKKFFLSKLSVAEAAAKPHFELTAQECALIAAYRQLNDEAQLIIEATMKSYTKIKELMRHKVPALSLVKEVSK